MLKLVAFVVMVLEHFNMASGLNVPLLQAVGRLAFPLFAQPDFCLAFRDTGVQWWQTNILFTFAAMRGAVRFMQTPCRCTAFVSLLALSV